MDTRTGWSPRLNTKTRSRESVATAATSVQVIPGGSFAQLDLPALSAGLNWRTDRLLSEGYLDIVSAIPEPASTATLAGLGLLGFVAIRRRRHRA